MELFLQDYMAAKAVRPHIRLQKQRLMNVL
jgi:hypothetical protein